MNREQILARMNAIAGDANITDEMATEYEGLERSLSALDTREGIRTRNAEMNRPGPGIDLGGENKRDAEDVKDVEYRKAFDAYMRSGKVNADLIQVRAQSEGVNSEGGYTVPESYRQRIVDRMVAFGGLASVVETITTGDGRVLPWPTIDDTANVGEIVAENGTFVSGADLVFGSADLGAYSYAAGGAGGQALRMSYELAQDTAFDLPGMVANKLGDRIARIQAQHIVTGTGVNQPLGITTGLVPVEPAAGTAITYADLLKFVHSVDPAYRGRARWAFNDQSLAYFRGILDANGRPLLKDASDGVNTSPGGETLLGYPVTIDQAFPNMDLDNDDVSWGVFGDLAEGYVIRRIRQIELLVNPYSRMNFRQIEYSAWARMDATQQNVNAYRTLSGFAA